MSESDTRSVWLSADADRSAARNERTVVVTAAPPPEMNDAQAHGWLERIVRGLAGAAGAGGAAGGADRTEGSIALPAASFEEVFVAHYARIRAAVARHAEPGVAVIAASTDAVHGEMWLAAERNALDAAAGHDESVRSAIVGRHGCADLFLPRDPGLSLRHAAVLAERIDGRTLVRVLDLRSEAGIRDEQGRRLAAVEADGPLLLRASRMLLFVLPTPATWVWPDEAAAGWAALPPRAFLDARERTGTKARAAVAPATASRSEGGSASDAESASKSELASPSASMSARSADAIAPNLARAVARSSPAPGHDREVTSVVSIAGPIGAQFESLLADGETPLGKLTIMAWNCDAEITIGPAAARRGILLGRYERCDAAGLAAMRTNALSRVHALLIEAGGELRLLDTASTNGTWREGLRVRSVPLQAGVTYRLATLRVRWDPAA